MTYNNTAELQDNKSAEVQDNKVVEMWKKKVNRKCSFCGTEEKDAKAMIKSNLSDHCICDKCIRQGKMLVTES